MCNQNQGKEKKSFRSPLLPVRPVQKSQKKLEKVFITNQYYQHTIPNLYFCPKIKSKKKFEKLPKIAILLYLA